MNLGADWFSLFRWLGTSLGVKGMMERHWGGKITWDRRGLFSKFEVGTIGRSTAKLDGKLFFGPCCFLKLWPPWCPLSGVPVDKEN